MAITHATGAQFKEAYTPMGRGFAEHMGYYQGCESHYTHVAACCTAGSPDHDQNYVCEPGHWYDVVSALTACSVGVYGEACAGCSSLGPTHGRQRVPELGP